MTLDKLKGILFSLSRHFCDEMWNELMHFYYKSFKQSSIDFMATNTRVNGRDGPERACVT